MYLCAFSRDDGNSNHVIELTGVRKDYEGVKRRIFISEKIVAAQGMYQMSVAHR